MYHSIKSACVILILGVLLNSSVAQKSAAPKGAQKAAAEEPAAGEVPQNPFPEAVQLPPGMLDGGSEWLNTSSPVDLKDLRGKIVVLDFWTYCCINCIHVLPDLKYLEEKYKNEIVVIGVHSAKFDNEKVSANIRDAILRYEIKHPVVNDDQMLIWRKFGTRSWPTLALIDPEGNFAGSQGGEGNRDLFDGVIERLIKYHRWKGTLNEKPIEFELEATTAAPTALRYPGKIVADAASNRLFISDSNHNRIVVTDLNGTHRETIGTGEIGRTDGSYSTARFDHPQGMTLVGNTLYVSDTENHLLRSIDLETETVSTLAGTGKQGRPGNVEGSLAGTDLNSPWALCHVDGTLYIAMAGPHQIWSHRLGTDKINVYAGSAREDVINGRLPVSAFAQPSGLTVNEDGSAFYVADSEGSSIRRVPTARQGTVTTIAGTFEMPRGQSLFAFGDVDATGVDARFQHPLGVAWYNGFVYVADTYNHKIRRVDAGTGEVTTWLGNGNSGDSLSQLNEPSGLSIANGVLYMADTNNHRILAADLKTKQVSLVSLTGVTAPAPKSVRRIPSLANAEKVAKQTVAIAKSVQIEVKLNIPLGGKLNAEAPLSADVFLIDGDPVLDVDRLESVRVSVTDDGLATFTVPLMETAGTANVAVEFSFGYCEDLTTGVCKLATGLWQFPLTTATDSDGRLIQLEFPTSGGKAAGADSDE